MSTNKKTENTEAKTEDQIRAELDKEYSERIELLEQQLEEAQENSESTIIPGLVTLELEDAKTGKMKKIKAGIADGYPTCRPFKGQNIVVKTKDLMKLAMGKDLSEEKSDAFQKLGFGKDKAIAFLEKLAISGSAMVKIEE